MSMSMPMPLRALAALAALSFLAGCASRPEVGALADNMAVAPGAAEHAIMVATSRARDPRPGTYFNGERSTAFDLAEFTVSVPPTHKHGEVELPQSGAGNPQTDFVVRDGGYIENEKAFVAQLNRRLAQKPRGQRSIIIFIHGYNTLFAEGLFRFAQVVHDSKSTAVPVHFSWASRGQLSDYVYDNNSATAARDRLERLFRLALGSNAEKVNVLARSMGDRGSDAPDEVQGRHSSSRENRDDHPRRARHRHRCLQVADARDWGPKEAVLRRPVAG